MHDTPENARQMNKIKNETAMTRIRVTLEITDTEVVRDYKNISDELVWEDLIHGGLINFAEFVSRDNILGRDIMNPHHPRCEHYTPPPADPRFARFGEAMWNYIMNLGGDFCGNEISEDILPLAQSAGLCCRVEYDPETHGADIEAEPGDEIWWWGDFNFTNTKPSNAEVTNPDTK